MTQFIAGPLSLKPGDCRDLAELSSGSGCSSFCPVPFESLLATTVDHLVQKALLLGCRSELL